MQCNWERQVLSDFIQKLSMELFTDVELDFDFSTAPPRWLLCVVNHMRCTASPSYTARVQGRFQCRAIKLSPSSRHKSQYGHCKGALCMHHPLNKPVILLYHGLHLALASHKILKKTPLLVKARAGEFGLWMNNNELCWRPPRTAFTERPDHSKSSTGQLIEWRIIRQTRRQMLACLYNGGSRSSDLAHSA